ncbi:hypothetical protein B0H66DRAFT_353033 [Apodospora peruviana]|uniref:Uncharacterized protein n=1 Tax=Apodospora peruviana TaxID=516989 RepID=A0AAE0LZH8_9PEZI|nr:hypothetical protein B0H66DRAFT_353033 [Apodospora peruviana]
MPPKEPRRGIPNGIWVKAAEESGICHVLVHDLPYIPLNPDLLDDIRDVLKHNFGNIIKLEYTTDWIHCAILRVPYIKPGQPPGTFLDEVASCIDENSRRVFGRTLICDRRNIKMEIQIPAELAAPGCPCNNSPGLAPVEPPSSPLMSLDSAVSDTDADYGDDVILYEDGAGSKPKEDEVPHSVTTALDGMAKDGLILLAKQSNKADLDRIAMPPPPPRRPAIVLKAKKYRTPANPFDVDAPHEDDDGLDEDAGGLPR